VEAWLDQLPIGGLSAGAILSIVVLMILRGALVPRRTHEECRADRDSWRVAWEASEEARRVQAAQLGELLELAKTTDKFIRALPRPPGGETS
jgi:hypothetical protein